jgi:mono/diheme cytochrome c family protein
MPAMGLARTPNQRGEAAVNRDRVRYSFGFGLALGVTVALLADTLGKTAQAQQAAATAVGDAEQIQQGKRLFISYGCGWCHEAGGRKAGRCPQLMNDPHDDEFFINRIVGGAPGRMPAFGQILVDTDIHAVIAYLRNLKPESD